MFLVHFHNYLALTIITFVNSKNKCVIYLYKTGEIPVLYILLATKFKRIGNTYLEIPIHFRMKGKPDHY